MSRTHVVTYTLRPIRVPDCYHENSKGKRLNGIFRREYGCVIDANVPKSRVVVAESQGLAPFRLESGSYLPAQPSGPVEHKAVCEPLRQLADIAGEWGCLWL